MLPEAWTLLFVGAVVAGGLLSIPLLIRWSRRRRSSPLSRWSYRIVVWPLILMGGIALVNNYVEDWGWPTALWILGFPLLFGVWEGISALRRPETPAPPPPAPTP